jgi:ketosteroid isomerase-like protein
MKMYSQLQNIQQNIREIEDNFESIFVRSDAASLADLYTEDGMVLPSGSEIIRGKENIQKFWQRIMDLGARQAKLETLEVERLLDTANELGRYTFKSESGKVVDQGKCMVIWKHENGEWKLHRYMFTSNLN